MDNKTYTLKSIILVKSNFTRITEIDFTDLINNKLSIDIEKGIEGNLLNVKLSVDLIGVNNKSNQNFKFDVSYIGTWEIGSEAELPLDVFSNLNAPAMMFPFVREHIANISLKAGLEAILLPTINFVKNANLNKKDTN